MTLAKQAAELLFLLLEEKSETKELELSIENLDFSDWQALYQAVANQGLFPIFYSRLSSLKPRGLPADFLRQFKDAYLLNLQKNIFYEQEILKITSYLKRYDITVIALKGPILARQFYNDMALRQASVDLDLLVRKEALSQIQRILSEMGYIPLQIEQKKDFLQPVRLNQQITQICMAKQKHDLCNYCLDIHTCLRGFFQQEQIQALWQQARYVRVGKGAALTLSSEDTLLYLSVISISLLESVRLRYLYDIHRLVMTCKEELDWDRLLRKARNYNLDTCLYFPLALSRSLFRTEIPEDILKDISPGRATQKLINLLISKEKFLSCLNGIKFNSFARIILCRCLYSRSWGNFFNKIFYRLLKEQKTERSRNFCGSNLDLPSPNLIYKC